MKIVFNGNVAAVNIYTTPEARKQPGKVDQVKAGRTDGQLCDNQAAPEAGRMEVEFAEDNRLDDRVGRKRLPWRGKKTKTMQLARAMHAIGQNKKANRVWWCAASLGYKGEPGQGGKLFSAGFCRERLCVMCAWRKSIKVFYELSRVLDVAQDENPNLDTIFLTLTVRNCDGSDLAAVVDSMCKGWKRMGDNRRYRDAVVGSFRALEVTYSADDDTYHPHFHAILLVDKQYFSDPKRYLHTKDWVSLWRVSCGLDYDPVCDIRATKTNKDKKRAHVAEVAKYTVKDTDIVHDSESTTARVVHVISGALKGRRLYAFGGVLTKIARQLKADKPGEGDLVNITGDETIRDDIAHALVVYEWDFGAKDYFRSG